MDDKTKAAQTADAKAAIEAASQQATATVLSGLKALQAAFPDNPKLALDAAAEGLSVEQAKARAYDGLKVDFAKAAADHKAALETVQAENGKLKKLLGSKGIKAEDIAGFDAADAQKPEQPKVDSKEAHLAAAKPFIDRVAALKATGMKAGAAGVKAAGELPEAYAAYEKAGSPAL